MKRCVAQASLAVALAAMVSGCAGIHAHKGAVIDPQLAELDPGRRRQ